MHSLAHLYTLSVTSTRPPRRARPHSKQALSDGKQLARRRHQYHLTMAGTWRAPDIARAVDHLDRVARVQSSLRRIPLGSAIQVASRVQGGSIVRASSMAATGIPKGTEATKACE